LKTRLKKITSVLIDYSTGHFSQRLRLSKELDEIDAVISGINMLGEELQATTISKNYFNNIFNTVSDMIFVVNQQGRIINANRAACEKLGFPENTRVGISIDRFLKKNEPSLKTLVSQVHKTVSAPPVEVETVFHKIGNQEPIPARCTITHLSSEGSKVQYLITAHDLTRIKAYEQSLKSSEEKYRKLFEESGDFIFLCDIGGDMLEINRAGYELLRLEPSGSKSVNLFRLLEEDEDGRSLLQKLAVSGEAENINVTIRNGNAQPLECLFSVTTMYTEDGTPAGYQGIIKDITLQKETEKQVIRAIIDTQEKERIRFAKDVHDSLGQQLSAIKFYIGTSLNASRDKKQRDILTKSNDALLRALADMRSICFNLMPKTLENFGLVPAISELCNYPGLQEHIQFHLIHDDHFPELNKSLEFAIFRIVQEFINNALKHGKAATVNIDIRLTQHNEIKIILQDDGKGFDTGKIGEMSGMGFKNVYSRVNSYNGNIHISSIPGKGTRYEISFPLHI
jgi:PAS domain S-box-containing protein